jgi:rhamnogalacturonan acetylesterase
MHLLSLPSLLLPLAVASALPEQPQVSSPTSSSLKTIPTIWVAGDSTTAPDGGHNGTEGWGQYLKYSFGGNAFINNSAYAGRSARSFTREGRFDRIATDITPFYFVNREMGINDGGIPTNSSTSTTGDKGRADCPGAGNETCTVIFKSVMPG